MDLSDYTGELRGVVGLRITDRINGPRGSWCLATATDLNLGFTIGCAATADPATGASCNLTTSADTLAAGTVLEGRRAIWEATQVKVFDGGADGDGDRATTPFATQGLYAPYGSDALAPTVRRRAMRGPEGVWSKRTCRV